LQVGYFSGVFFNGFVLRARKGVPGHIEQEEQQLISTFLAQEEVDRSLPALKRKLAAMKGSRKAETPEKGEAARATKATQ
jgi:hypothetical protein